jgi:hypothetical protein
MAEATEELIKIYLEQKGYFVTTSKRINVKNKSHSSRTELDIVAIKTKNAYSNLPSKIVGEVKSYSINPRCFKKLDIELRSKYNYKSRSDYDRYKWLNDDGYKTKILNTLKQEYGFNFEYVLFCSDITPKKYETEVKAFLKKENIYLVLHKDILKYLFENRTNEYTNNQILQLIRLIKKNTTKIEFKCENDVGDEC